MRRSLLLCIVLTCCWLRAGSAEAQTPVRFDLSAYERVTSGVFADFTYPARPLFEGAAVEGRRKSLTLRRGLFRPRFDERGYIERIGAYLKSVEFADVTGDGRNEALVSVGNICDCTGVWFGIYVYELAGRKPTRLLWAFKTGNRADGGLRRVYGRRGKLMVELYGTGSGPNLPPKSYNGSACCTDDYTQRKYRWNGRRFIQEGKARVLLERRV